MVFADHGQFYVQDVEAHDQEMRSGGSPAPGHWSNTPAWHQGRTCPGTFKGRTKLTGQGRPGLRLAAWRAVWGAQRANPVYAARFAYLTTREHNKLTVTQAQAVIAAAILRQLHAIVTTGKMWNPVIAAHGPERRAVLPIAA